MSHFVKIFIKRLKIRKLKMCVSDERVKHGGHTAMTESDNLDTKTFNMR